MNPTDKLLVANEILKQLGGPRFLAMTGARHLVGSDNALQFKLPRGGKDGINAVRVELDPTDTYTVSFFKIARGGVKFTTVAAVSLVYADGLRTLFTEHTGLRTSL